MHFKHNRLASLGSVALGAILALGFLGEIKAQAQAADVAGTWTWSVRGRQSGSERKITATFKVDGEKVTGKLSMPTRGGDVRETEIKDGKISGDELSFNTTREVNGNTMTTKYTGKVSGDTIKGKMEFERNGEPVHRDWEAKRSTGGK